jgi:hypothetical protein
MVGWRNLAHHLHEMNLLWYILHGIMSVIQPAANGNWITNSNPCTTMSKATGRDRAPATVFNLTESDKKRFYEKFTPKSPDECWDWEAGKFSNGYGAFKVKGKLLKATRVAFFLANGELDPNLLLLHKCHRPCCVNHHHLYQGTHKKNMEDMAAAGRAACGDDHWTRANPEKVKSMMSGDNNPLRKNPSLRRYGDDHHARKTPECLARGEHHASSKLTEEKVLEIRARFAAGGISKAALGREYGVNETAIGFIIRRESWTHI